ncbi:MAG: PAS domain-containing sensor histidine kinase [Notoacmeibacter sp.]|nr:PAS domain-containing sensor histidine kinase [Notoacmeibacter sp.]
MKYLVIISAALGAVLLFLLAGASANTDYFTRNFPWLLGLNLSLAATLSLLIAIQLRQLRRKLKARIFGARLTLRLLLMFALMAILPGIVVYGVSVQFLNKSIESWFDVRVDNALEGGMNLGRTALDHLQQDLTKKGESMALALSDLPPSTHLTELNTLREQLGVQEAVLFSQRGNMIAYAGNERAGMLPELPNSSILRQVRMQKPYSGTEMVPGKGLYMRVVVPVNVLSLNEDIRILQLLQPVPPRLSKDAETVGEVYRAYQELSLSRLGLKRISGLILTLTLLLALLSAIALAFVLSERLSAPLAILAEGTRAVAKGDFSAMPEVQSRDELGLLTQSFNSMTRQLADARGLAEFNQRQLEAAKIYLESILSHLSSGVLAFDRHFRIGTANPSAAQILGADLVRLRGMDLSAWGKKEPILEPFAATLLEQFEQNGEREWQQQIEFTPVGGGRQVLLMRGTRLPPELESGYIVVFDEITHLLQAQRDAAWGEVARRLAHEIKNPLTPIQLSAERIKRRYGKVITEDREVFDQCTDTIIRQVGDIGRMVDEFSAFARMPKPSMALVDLREALREASFLVEVSRSEIEFEREFPDEPLTGKFDNRLMSQAIGNLIKNAAEAIDSAALENPGLKGAIRVSARRSGGNIVIEVIDNGRGLPRDNRQRLLEPYMTTREKGTGLGLAIVRKIVEDHGGKLELHDAPADFHEGRGAMIRIVLPAVDDEPQSRSEESGQAGASEEKVDHGV